MRVCVVGCGAVGSLFAANLAQTRRRRGVGLRRLAGARRRDQRERPAARRARARWSATHGDDATRPSSRRATSASSRRRRCTPRARSPRRRTPSRTAPSRPSRTASATRRSSPRHVARVIRGTTFPAGKILEPGVVQWDVKGDTTFGPFEPQPATLDEIERLADACTRGGMPTTAVADARPAQWRKVIFNASTNPVGALTGLTHGRVCERPDLRAIVSALVDEGKAVAAAQGIDARRRSRGAHRPRGEARGRVRPQGEHAPGRRGAARDRDRLPERRHRTLRARARRARLR